MADRRHAFELATITTERLVLTPLREADADTMVSVLDDEQLHAFIGGRPASHADLRRRYRQLVAGSGDPDEIWLNWIVRLRVDNDPIGTVQATVARSGDGWAATIAWIIGVPWQARGLATEAARALVGWLHDQGATVITATIHPDHHASGKVAARAGLTATAERIDGERVWRTQRPAEDDAKEDDAKELVRRGYDAISYDYRADQAGEAHYGDWISRLLPCLPAGGDVLDLGCGCGIPVCRVLDDTGHSVTGVDISEVQIERARRLVPGGTFIRADATQVTFPPASFDAVICLFALIHIPLDEQSPLLERIAAWLRPGGTLLITTGHAAWTGTEANWHGVPMWWSHADAATYRDWLTRAGLRVDDDYFFPEGDGGHAVFYATRP